MHYSCESPLLFHST